MLSDFLAAPTGLGRVATCVMAWMRHVFVSLAGAQLMMGLLRIAACICGLTFLAAAATACVCLRRAVRASRAAGYRSRAFHDQRVAQRQNASVGVTPPSMPVNRTGDLDEAGNDNDELFQSPDAPENDPRRGSACVALFFAVLASLLLVAVSVRANEAAQAAPAAVPVPAPEAPAIPVMDFVKLDVRAPEMGRDEERSAEVLLTFSFEADYACQFRVLDVGAVLTHSQLGSRSLSLVSSDEGYVLKVSKKGAYSVALTCQVLVSELNGRWGVELALLPNMRNEVLLHVAEVDLDVQCPRAVLFRTSAVANATQARALFGPVDKVKFTWQPRVRKTRLEKAVYICEVNTLASFEPGVVDVLNLVRFQIAQGEIKAMQLHVPEGMSVTSVQADGLSTWRFDPEQRLFDAVLESPVTGDFEMQVMSQVATESLPYQVTLGALEVEGAARQRGAIAIASPDTVQARIGGMQGLTAMR